MLIVFELSMPNVGSWNGRWTGENDIHARVMNFSQRYGTSKIASEKSKSIIGHGRYYYNFGDGWGASITAREVKTSEATKIRRKSKGFCGYDWMIDSILQYGKILNSSQIEEMECVK